jgi:hypothetical protein
MRIYAVLFAALLCTSCKTTPTISGNVVDFEGKPLVGAQVEVVGSTFHATTDKEGKYQVEYAPGTVTVKYSRKATSGTDRDSNDETRTYPLATATKYPAAPVELLPIPIASFGVLQKDHKFGSDLNSTPYQSKDYEQQGTDPFNLLPISHHILFIKPDDTKANILHSSLPLTFIETDDKHIHYHPYRVNDDGQFADFWHSPVSAHEVVINELDDPTEIRGKLIIHHTKIGPGKYIWAQSQRDQNGFTIYPGSVFPFTVD